MYLETFNQLQKSIDFLIKIDQLQKIFKKIKICPDQQFDFSGIFSVEIIASPKNSNMGTK